MISLRRNIVARSMMTSSNGNISALLALCEGNPRVTCGFPSQRPVTRNFDVICFLRLNKQLSKNRDAGNLRRYRTHYDVTVMFIPIITIKAEQFSHDYKYGLIISSRKGSSIPQDRHRSILFIHLSRNANNWHKAPLGSPSVLAI